MKINTSALRIENVRNLSGNYRKFKSSPDHEPLAKTYNPKDIERYLYPYWEQNGLFRPQENSKKPNYSIIIPPPNVTGTLHLGHALTVTIQDVLARWHRMCGRNVLWVPGTDHAGIATQAVVERTLERRTGATRHSLGKERLRQEIFAWKEEKTKTIHDQLRRLGASLDWSREFFTMDEAQGEAVLQAIVTLFDADLIYRRESLINWSCRLRSVVSDIEVDKMPVSGPTQITVPGYDRPVTFGQLTDFAYKRIAEDGEIVVSTSRVETMLGDVAIAVHPDDSRYSHLHRAKFIHPVTGLILPIIPDPGVNPEFGTGAVKITPAHDQFDLDLSHRHGLPVINVVSEDGRLSEDCYEFSGMHRFEAREAVTEFLGGNSLLRGFRDNPSVVPICSRSGDVIELLIKPQWFVRCQEMGRRAADDLRSGALTIDPPQFHDTWYSWLDNIKDWCISRQLWWGHQLPFYRCANHLGGETFVAAENENDAIVRARRSLIGELEIERETDVLDTWFSSALLPFSNFQWPKATPDLKVFYPLSEMVTGHDIVFFWVARMVMLGTFLTGQLPFKKVCLHGILCDSYGRKMSKSRGNVVSPEDVIDGASLQELKKKIDDSCSAGILSETEAVKARSGAEALFPDGIPACGADALRLTLLSSKVKSHYVHFDVNSCHGSKLFGNKIWQASKFVTGWWESLRMTDEEYQIPEPRCLMDRWILAELSEAVDVTNRALEEKDFHLGIAAFRGFVQNSFCDIYLEYSKDILRKKNDDSKNTSLILMFVMDTCIRALSPFMPFICETLYQSLPVRSEDTSMYCVYPKDLKFPGNEKDHIKLLLEIVSEFRKLKTSVRISNRDRPKVALVTQRTDLEELVSPIQALAGVGEVWIGPSVPSKSKTIFAELNDIHLYLFAQDMDPVKSLVNSGLDLRKKEKIIKELSRLEAMRANEGYKKVADTIQRNHEKQITKLRNELAKIETLFK